MVRDGLVIEMDRLGLTALDYFDIGTENAVRGHDKMRGKLQLNMAGGSDISITSK